MLEKFVDKYIKYQTERGLLLDEEAGVYRYGYMLLLETIINIVIMPKFLYEVTDEIYKEDGILYHITPL